MTTVGDDLDLIDLKLHDPDGALWSRAERLRWYVDAYRQMLAVSGAVRRWRPLDVPGRHTYSGTQEWEARHAQGGTFRKMSRAGLGERYQSSSLWEVEQTAGVATTTSLNGVTQEWERAHLSGGLDVHYRFTFPRNHQRIVRLEWQGRRLVPISVRELDETDTNWWSQGGEPRFWSTGAGRVRSVELYEITTNYVAAYHLKDSDHGFPRTFTGTRTWGVTHDNPIDNAWAYTTRGEAQALETPPTIAPPGLGYRMTLENATVTAWATQPWEIALIDGVAPAEEAETLVFGVGGIRGVSSSDRQYLAVYSDAQPALLCGRVGEWRSSADSLLALEVITPDLDLLEEDTPALIPAPLQKYLRYYVLSRAFGRPGEGRSPVMADHYARRYNRGVSFLQRLSDVTRKDRQWQREEFQGDDRRRPARVRFPAEFPRSW